MLDHVSLATERAAARLDFAKNDRMILLRSHYFSALAPARHGLRAAISLLLYFLLELNGASSLCSSLAGTDYDQLLNCRCDVNNIVCTGVPVLPVLSRVYPEITVLEVIDGKFTYMGAESLQAFPGLTHLLLRNGNLRNISCNALANLHKVVELDLSNNQLVEMPFMRGLKKLQIVNVARNRIPELRNEHIRASNQLITLKMDYNRLTRLNNGVFAGACNLQQMHLSHNDRLVEIEEDVFSRLFITTLDLSFTSISHLPVKHLRLTLEYLFINGTESLKSLPLRLSGLDYGVNRTFPFLKNISVEYPAHCCLVSDQHTLRFGLPSKRAVTGSASKHHQPWKRSSQMFVCLNTISGDLVNSYTPNQSEIFNLTELCSSITHCFGGRCFDNCQAPVMESGLLPIIEIPQIACIQELKPSTTVPIAPTMSSFGISSIVFSTICVTSSPSLYSSSSITPTPTPPPPTTTTQPPMPDCTSGFKFFCQFSSCGAPLCSVCLPSICSRKRSVRVNYEVMSAHLDHRRAVDDQNPDILCSVVAFTSTRVCVTPSPTLSSTPDQLPPSSICSVVLISLAPTVSHTSLCFTVTRTLSPSSSSAYSLTNSLAPSPTHTIHAEETTVEVACSTIETAPMSTPAVIVTSTVSSTEITMVTTVSVTPTPSVDLLIQECEPIPRFPPSYYHLTNQTVSCDPGNDAFNPCNDIFESNVLRTAVWIVILIIIGGNTTVIGVTILYLIIHYRHKQRKSHIMFYLYLNLAFADLLMGFYLLTIASEDLITIGRFSEFAVEWQTGYGCQFAGFCAILSGMMSVYTLLVITIERVYSIRFALESRQLRKRHAIWIMIFGWLLGIFIAALPLPFIGASSYSRVSICLPFETRGPEDIIYLIFILFSTGMGTFIISCSYIYIFYLVAYTARKRGMHRTINNKEEFYLALRMCILVLTNFVCWGPIAFFSITAMCGLPIIGVEDAKVLIVIIFPINSCLNPILYSFSTKTFRQNLLNQLNKCGLFKSHSRQLRAQRSSGAVATSTERITSTDRRGSLMTMLMSISSYGNSRRNSTLSGTSGLSLEEGTAIQNPGFVMSRGFHRPSITSTDSNASSGDEEDRLPMPLPVAYLRQARASQSSLSGLVSGLQAVPEEKECDTQFNVNDNDQVQTETETVIVHRWSMDSTESVNTELKYNKADNEEDEDSFSGKTTKLGVTNRLITEDNTTIFSNPYSGASLSPQLSSKRQATDEVHPSSLN